MSRPTEASLSSPHQGRTASVRLWMEIVKPLAACAVLCDLQWTVLAFTDSLHQLLPEMEPDQSLLEALRPVADPFLAARLNSQIGRKRGKVMAQIGLRWFQIEISHFSLGEMQARQIVLRPPSRAPALKQPARDVLPVPELLAIAQEPLFAWRLNDHAIEYWNGAAEQLYGYTAAAANGQRHDDLLQTQSGEGFDKIVQQLVETRRWSGELSHRASDGETILVEASMVLVDRDGASVVWQANRDVTARRHTEQALQFHFELNRSITNQAVDPIFVVGGNGEIIFANPEASRVFGWSQEELVGRPLHETLHHHTPEFDAYPSTLCPLLEAQRSGSVVRSMELVFFRRDGSPVPVSCSNSPLQFRGNEVGAVLIIRDISRLKSIEGALAQSEERLRLAVDASRIGIWDLHLESRRLTLDANSREALGLASTKTVSVATWLRALHPEDRKEVKTSIERTLNPEGSGHFAVDCRTWSGTDQRLRFVQIHGQALVEEHDGVRTTVRLVGTIQDVSAAKRIELALRQANQDLQEFAYAAAHDLQEPLRNLMNLHGLHQRSRKAGLESGEDLIEASAKEARRMHDMVRDLLLFSEAGQQIEPVQALTDSNLVLKEALVNLGSALAEVDAQIRYDPLPFLKVRPAHLSQLLQNLVGNALKYRHPDRKPVIQISVRRRGADWLFSIADNGIGFDPVYARRIFGVFKRLHGQAEYPGSGIGLAICARIVALYGGRIWAESQPGQGAAFLFTLPVASE